MSEPSKEVRAIRRELHDDGTVLDTEFVAAPVLSDADPFVRTRLVPQNHEAGSEVITEFAPASARPISYPTALPFIANREVWTTESPAGTGLEGARWPGADLDALLTSVVEASVADGWTVIAQPPAHKLLGTPDVVLQRGSLYRELQIVRIDDTGILQLWDVPTSWFDSRPA